MMDELHSPSPTKKRKSTAGEASSPPHRARKKQKSGNNASLNGTASRVQKSSSIGDGPAAKMVAPSKSAQIKTSQSFQENTVAGPSTRQSKPSSSQTPTRISSRVSRPTPKKAAQFKTDVDSESDSDRTPPASIVPQNTPTKKRKLSHTKMQKAEKITRPKVHLGAFELSSGSEEDARAKPPRKRAKPNHNTRTKSEVIDLCSDGEKGMSSSKKTRTLVENNVVIILSSSDEAEPSKSSNLRSAHEEVGQSNEGKLSLEKEPAEVQSLSQRPEPPSMPQESDTHGATGSAHEEAGKSNEGKLSLEKEPAEVQSLSQRPEPPSMPQESDTHDATDFILSFTSSKSTCRSHSITYAEDIPVPALHTPLFFSRTISSVKASAAVRKKRALLASKKAISPVHASSPGPSSSEIPHGTSLESIDIPEKARLTLASQRLVQMLLSTKAPKISAAETSSGPSALVSLPSQVIPQPLVEATTIADVTPAACSLRSSEEVEANAVPILNEVPDEPRTPLPSTSPDSSESFLDCGADDEPNIPTRTPPSTLPDPMELLPDSVTTTLNELRINSPPSISSDSTESSFNSSTTDELPFSVTPSQKPEAETCIRSFDISIIELSEISISLLMGGFNCTEEEEDDISLSGLELTYPEEIF